MTSARLRPLAFAFLSAFSAAAIATEAPLAADTYVTTVAPAANYGATVNLNVGGGATALLRFDLGALPDRAMPSNLLKATLVLYVNRVGVAGSIDVHTVGSAWSEASVTAATAPVNDRNGSTATAAVSAAGQFVSIDVTDKVMAWIAAGSAGNFGFAIQPSSAEPATTVFFDSKENSGTGHAARLDLTLANQGPAGPQGPTGAPGPAGASTGVAGPAGPMGPAGAKGDTGAAGPVGPTGAIGPAGPTGAAGAAGAAGAVGATGAPGAPGVAGPAGPAGAQGAKGDTGATGAQGPRGDTGLAGAAGPAGPAGPTGATGPAGAVGAVGPAGPVGATGPTGLSGPAGPAGAVGPVGPVGATGPVGPAGPMGATGATGAVGAQGPAGPKGPTGATGAQGPAGPQGAPGVKGVSGSAVGFGEGTNGAAGRGADCTLGQVTLSAGYVGVGLPADGRLLPIAQNQALFSLLGTIHGGDGRTTFALPNLRAVTPNNMTYYVCTIGIYPSRE